MMEEVGNTWSDLKGKLIPVFECEHHGVRNTSGVCAKCVQEVEEWHEEEASLGIL